MKAPRRRWWAAARQPRGSSGVRTTILRAAVLSLAVVVPTTASGLSRSYICFFDRGSAELTPRCQEVAMEFASEWKRARAHGLELRVELSGHADRGEVGPDRLSARRAEALAAFLRLNDVRADLIRVVTFGSRRLLIPTEGPWREEPQNRRVDLWMPFPVPEPFR